MGKTPTLEDFERGVPVNWSNKKYKVVAVPRVNHPDLKKAALIEVNGTAEYVVGIWKPQFEKPKMGWIPDNVKKVFESCRNAIRDYEIKKGIADYI